MAEEAFGVRRMKLGSQGLEVSAQGLGCMGLSAFYGAPTPETNAVALLRHAITAGITFLDTSDFYGPFQMLKKPFAFLCVNPFSLHLFA
ncbi:hypothetical protein F2Q70_00001732 [Brassica cretica]|uniref:NADP-dependent oxidoreductase domain-containing protein n=1 Tax=Brassica cretica TaxID=69181 RepID=A0A8S9IL61_BRACR|nr:hypothetical protein F2Q70_00001732 [Brassica cretica]